MNVIKAWIRRHVPTEWPLVVKVATLAFGTALLIMLACLGMLYIMMDPLK